MYVFTYTMQRFFEKKYMNAGIAFLIFKKITTFTFTALFFAVVQIWIQTTFPSKYKWIKRMCVQT